MTHATDASRDSQDEERALANRTRYRGDARGHYESFFSRANHPSRPLAFWLRYTIFSPKGRPEDALGELWGMFFDGEAGRILALRQAEPLGHCTFGADRLEARVLGAGLDASSLHGELRGDAGTHLRWQLTYEGGGAPLYLLPRKLYAGGFPKAKALVGSPGCRYQGSLWIRDAGDAGERLVPVDGWRGSQNHNWGSKHTDAYAWLQCAGFDGVPDAFLECAIARVKLGPVWTPAITLLTLRVADEEFAFDDLLGGARQSGHYAFGPQTDPFRFEAERARGDVRIRVRCQAAREDFVALTYLNPPGGQRICLNTKIARCEVELLREGYAPQRLQSAHGAAFEILADDPCGLPLRV